jgi:hypothetical protein
MMMEGEKIIIEKMKGRCGSEQLRGKNNLWPPS